MKRLLALDRRILIGVPIAALVLLLIGFGIGRLTATDSTASASGTENAASGSENSGSATPDSSQGDDPDAPPSTITGDAAAALPPASDTPEEGIPVYGTEAEREALLMGLIESGVAGGTRQGLLATADHVCYTLERLEAQNRSPAFAVRVVWNESLAELDSQDLAAFAAVFNAAPQYLCTSSVEYAEEVAYWLGY